MYASFVNYLHFLIPVGAIAIIIFAIATVVEGKNSMKKGLIIRSLYFYLASLITLAIVVGSLVFLINLGLKTWVFPEADYGSVSYLGPPPGLYLEQPTAQGESKPILTGQGLTCEDKCTLTDTQKTSIGNWQTNYKSWVEAKANPGPRRLRDMVAALSFLIVALPFFIIHFRIVQKDAKLSDDSERSVIRPTYFYFVALGSLIMMVVAGGFLINIALKTWVFPQAGKVDEAASKAVPIEITPSPEKAGVQSLITCGEKCGLDKDTIDLAKQWVIDYDVWQTEVSKPVNNTQRSAAASIPYVVLGIPLFWYHWSVARKESKEKKTQTTTPPTQPIQ